VPVVVDKIGDIVRITMALRINLEQVQMVNFHLLCNATGGTDTRLTLLSHVNQDFINVLSPVIYSGATYLGSKCFTQEAKPRPASVFLPVRTPATGGSHCLPTSVRPVVQFQTRYAGKRYRGRVYAFTPDTDSALATGHSTASVGDKWVSMFNTWINGYTINSST
jgi:hypothetical protein